MAKNRPTDVIDAYRRRQERRSPFMFADVSKVLLLLIITIPSIYVLLAGGPKLPALVDLKTNTPTFTPSITPTPSQTATVTLMPTETPDPELQCDCPSPAPEIVVITATFSDTDTPMPTPSITQTATATTSPFTATPTLTFTVTFTPTNTPTSTASITPTPTQILYTVRTGDTLSDVAFRYGVTVEAIQALNNLDGTLIYVGQVLQIPRP